MIAAFVALVAPAVLACVVWVGAWNVFKGTVRP
jgi:hypothetical protein